MKHFATALCMACAATNEAEGDDKEVVERSDGTRRCGVSPRRHGGAGGVGGLLYVKINGAIYVPWYDAYGNVMGYWDGECIAAGAENVNRQYPHWKDGTCGFNKHNPEAQGE